MNHKPDKTIIELIDELKVHYLNKHKIIAKAVYQKTQGKLMGKLYYYFFEKYVEGKINKIENNFKLKYNE